MAIIEHSKTVLHRGREAPEILEEETAELAAKPQRRVPTPAEQEEMIAQAAYYRSQQRHFVPGQELEDWLEAEAELKAQLDRP